jgi:hypothetical protein
MSDGGFLRFSVAAFLLLAALNVAVYYAVHAYAP